MSPHLNPAGCCHSDASLSDGRGWTSELQISHQINLRGREMINGRGKKKKQSSDTQICFQFLDFFSNLWFLLKYWIIWTFIEMKACEKFRGKNHYLVELLTTHRHVKCDPDYTLLFVRRQKPKRLETTGFIFNNVLYFKSLLYYPLCQIFIWKVTKAVK